MTVARCNAYGAENKGGTPELFGGLLEGQYTLRQVHYCPNVAVHRFRWQCEHGHLGPIVNLCEQHWAEFSGRRAYRDPEGRAQGTGWNVRRDVRACPRCAAEAPDCQDPDHQAMMRGRPGRCGCQEHKCKVRLVTVS